MNGTRAEARLLCLRPQRLQPLADEEFEVSSDVVDEWDDLLDDSADDEKQKDIRDKLNKLKKAAKKK